MNYITANSLQRVFQVKSWNSVWTWFTIEKNKVQYLITAKHVFKWNIKILLNDKFIEINSEPIFPNNTDIDIVWFKLEKPISPILSIWIGKNWVIWGQDLFFYDFLFELLTGQISKLEIYVSLL